MLRFLFLGFLLAGLSYVFLQSIEQGRKIYRPEDLTSQFSLYKIRVLGRVRNIKKVDDRDGFTLAFDLVGENSHFVKTVYEGFKPELLKDGVSAIVDGDWVDGVLIASNVLTQCPSKYEPNDKRVTVENGLNYYPDLKLPSQSG
ncbi:MAG: cytochrome c maturation protein CcmE [Deltaproteobacteria bacterium]|nr:cytochrome c maturation protein CcmE [Deltaproteobacteria bacterium]MCX7952210.1 cytochrome c maturation protein CcmE [Deltaproteobacteria bacterium]